jgi:polar amino acid transport system substrate-binding protein
MKVSRRIVVAAAMAAMLAGAGEASAQIKFGVAAEPYPPFTSKDASGKWVGWEVDLMDAVCKAMNEKCEIVEVAWDGIIPALTSKQIDVIWSSMTITGERMKTIDFTDFYYNPAAVIVGQKDGDMSIAPDHLKGKTLGAQVATIHLNYLQKHYGAGSEIKSYQTFDEHNSDLAAGRLDYAMADGSAMDAFLQTDQGKACCEVKDKVPTDPEVLGQGVGGGLRKEDTALKEKLNAAIKAVSASGEIAAITKKYPELEGKLITP